MSFTALSVNVAEARQNRAPGRAAMSQSQRLCLEEFTNPYSVIKNIHIKLWTERAPVWEETRPPNVLIGVHHLWTMSQLSGRCVAVIWRLELLFWEGGHLKRHPVQDYLNFIYADGLDWQLSELSLNCFLWDFGDGGEDDPWFVIHLLNHRHNIFRV